MKSKPVKFVINPTNEWVEVDSWPPSTSPSNYYFHSGGSTSFSSFYYFPLTTIAGEISKKSILEGEKQVYKYTYDPENPTPVVGGYLLFDGGPQNNQPFINERLTKFNDIVYFQSPVFEVHFCSFLIFLFITYLFLETCCDCW